MAVAETLKPSETNRKVSRRNFLTSLAVGGGLTLLPPIGLKIIKQLQAENRSINNTLNQQIQEDLEVYLEFNNARINALGQGYIQLAEFGRTMFQNEYPSERDYHKYFSNDQDFCNPELLIFSPTYYGDIYNLFYHQNRESGDQFIEMVHYLQTLTALSQPFVESEAGERYKAYLLRHDLGHVNFMFSDTVWMEHKQLALKKQIAVVYNDLTQKIERWPAQFRSREISRINELVTKWADEVSLYQDKVPVQRIRNYVQLANPLVA